jgi:SRSO17 transposase
MDQEAFARVAASFAAFHREFAPLFGRTDTQRRSEQYLRGLLVQQTDRRNAENVAELVEGATPRALQRLLTEAPWPIEPVIDRLQAYLGPRLNTPEGVFVLDESGFPKQGRHSVGVARQYCGAVGKVANCQIGVFLSYASARGHALVDMRLWLPRVWIEDPARCHAAGVPEGMGYQSMAELGLAMLRQTRARGWLAGDWVAGDDSYGKAPTLRDALDADHWRYVLDVPTLTPVCTDLLTPAAAVPVVAAALPAAAWQQVTVADGAQGPRRYAFVACRVWESREGQPGRAGWLLARRNLDGTAPRYYLSNAPADTALGTLAAVAATRWVIETDFQTAKGETGMDEYEVRSWRGWHHHIAFALLAGAFLLTLQQDWGEKYAPGDPSANQPSAPRTPAPPPLDHHGPVHLARPHPRVQCARQTRPSHATSTPAA